MRKKMLFSIAGGSAACLAIAYMMQEDKCLSPDSNITSKSQAINAVKRNIDYLSGGHKEVFESLENFTHPILAEPGQAGNGWGAWEMKESSPKMRKWFVMYSQSKSNDSFEIDCEVACGGITLYNCLTMNMVNLKK